MPSENQHASVFDLDHTLLKVNSSYSLGSFFYRKKLFSFFTMLNLAGTFWVHKCGLLSIAEMQHQIFKRFFLNRSYSSVRTLAEAFVQEQFSQMLYLPAVERLRQAQRQGHHTVILSSSPAFLVELFAERFGVDAWDATHYAVDGEQRFSGITRFMLSQDKAAYLIDLSHRLNIPPNNITAYSDSHLDLDFLKAAGHPVGVNPDRKLKALCRQNNWPII
jgi:HAD superfamily hydrolase (TIGR01490 family)